MARLDPEAATAVRAAVASTTGPKLVFVGFMGSGKSRAARHAKRLLDIDPLDDALWRRNSANRYPPFSSGRVRPPSANGKRPSCSAFSTVRTPGSSALGGGAVLSDLVRERLTDHLCIYMEVEPEIAWERVRESPRPLAHDRTSFLDLLSQRALRVGGSCRHTGEGRPDRARPSCCRDSQPRTCRAPPA